ncbi:glycerophosphodiester phosphodiesterase [Roseinatronobacter alkalisoli]|uniref:Glycerophosphodiester phosphodiesterase n=1 Tax=Roseinatronobacter alkalisoli TaxID=3028235 RepID=A0ABT5T8G6_9RHOB|nr:glycerophosphodiester phosphodiesterase [Roseinatronobacter sp. HJB301]MDD7970457.1 glycerophosphodiester phosphodiesterase [Roseinatronobacter sp. HJB301]
MARLSTHPFLSSPGARGFAHRGGALEAEENTLPAFRHAVALGYSHVELDVHATRDGVVVVHHDADLTRLFDDPRTIAASSWAELKPLRTKAGAGIPRLETVLEEFPDLFIAIEAKSLEVVEPLVRLITRMNALERVCIGAFDPARTSLARRLLGPDLLWSPAHMQVARLWASGFGLPLALDDFAVVQIPVSWRGIPLVTPRFLRAAHARGVHVQVWTVNDDTQMRTLLDWGVDGLMTDRPTLLQDVLNNHRR